jgi:hypothetical protein
VDSVMRNGRGMTEREPLWKYGTEREAVTAKRDKRQRFVKRRQCRQIVYRREGMKCQRCGKQTKLPRECWPGDPDMAHVNEPEGRGNVDYTNLDNCELVCGECHMPNGEHAPTVERMQQIRARTKR